MSSFVDAAFSGAGQSVGLELWRIENKAPVKQGEVSSHLGICLAGLSGFSFQLTLFANSYISRIHLFPFM